MVNGPLRNPARLREILKTDFIKAVLSVILPSKQRLEQMRRSPDTEEYIKVECQLLREVVVVLLSVVIVAVVIYVVVLIWDYICFSDFMLGIIHLSLIRCHVSLVP